MNLLKCYGGKEHFFDTDCSYGPPFCKHCGLGEAYFHTLEKTTKSKHCGGCNVNKVFAEFGKDKHRGDGLTSQCKECRNKRCSKYRKEHPEFIKHLNKMNTDRRKKYYADPVRKRKYKNLELKRMYNITIEQYDALFEKQKGLCAICLKPELGTRNDYLAVDHCHKTNKVRGLLCNFCNRAIGLLCDDISTLERAVVYLEEHE